VTWRAWLRGGRNDGLFFGGLPREESPQVDVFAIVLLMCLIIRDSLKSVVRSWLINQWSLLGDNENVWRMCVGRIL
jgi:hypothetical protein